MFLSKRYSRQVFPLLLVVLLVWLLSSLYRSRLERQETRKIETLLKVMAEVVNETATRQTLAVPEVNIIQPPTVKAVRFSLIYSRSSPSALSARLCALLAAKSLLFIGGPATFHLHTLFLRSRETEESRSHSCLGPEQCTFHHICLPPGLSSSSDDATVRFHQRPKTAELKATSSSLIGYLESWSLPTTIKSDSDTILDSPIIDPRTGVVIKESYWMGPARNRDVLILGRGPIPAPAWTYDGTTEGNWSFASDILPHPALGERSLYSSDLVTGIVNAALLVFLDHYLSAVNSTLQFLGSDKRLRERHIKPLWHEQWYTTPMNAPDRDPICILRWQLRSENARRDPWALYHNMQGTLVRFIALLPNV